MAITPVPGGVGPMTIACLLRNTLEAAYNCHGLMMPDLRWGLGFIFGEPGSCYATKLEDWSHKRTAVPRITHHDVPQSTNVAAASLPGE
jgi:Tetrahydrofolate dehydrogenase/cyclohydrolase, NAD(P)-binding domain